MLDRLLVEFIKKGKEQLENGEISAIEFAETMNQIYEKMKEFNGMTMEQFWK
jgi:hypothetical protein